MNWKEEWKIMLSDWNEETFNLLQKYKSSLGPSAKKILELGTCWRPPASNEEIMQAEAKLGIKLPNCVRAFYEVTNGWMVLGYYKDLFLIHPVNKLVHTKLEEDWLLENLSDYPDVDDEDYRDYQQYKYLRPRDIESAISLNPTVSAAKYLLNPNYSSMDGEWDAVSDNAYEIFRAPNLFGLLSRERDLVLNGLISDYR